MFGFIENDGSGPAVASTPPPTNLEIQEAVQFHGRFPEELRSALAEPIGAMGFVFACVVIWKLVQRRTSKPPPTALRR